jgi:hypothetical protein
MEPNHETIAAITDRLRQAAAVAEATVIEHVICELVERAMYR